MKEIDELKSKLKEKIHKLNCEFYYELGKLQGDF